MEHILLKINVSDITYLSELIPSIYRFLTQMRGVIPRDRYLIDSHSGLIRADNLRCTSCCRKLCAH